MCSKCKIMFSAGATTLSADTATTQPNRNWILVDLELPAIFT